MTRRFINSRWGPTFRKPSSLSILRADHGYVCMCVYAVEAIIYFQREEIQKKKERKHYNGSSSRQWAAGRGYWLQK